MHTLTGVVLMLVVHGESGWLAFLKKRRKGSEEGGWKGGHSAILGWRKRRSRCAGEGGGVGCLMLDRLQVGM